MNIIYNVREISMDELDSKLLTHLQRDASTTTQVLGDQLHLSPSQIGRRKQRLEETGIIQGYRAKLDPERLGLTVQAFIQVQMRRHGSGLGDQFISLVKRQPEIISTWTLTGEADYLLRVYCRDLDALNELIHGVLLPNPAVARVQSQIVMAQLKADAPLPC